MVDVVTKDRIPALGDDRRDPEASSPTCGCPVRVHSIVGPRWCARCAAPGPPPSSVSIELTAPWLRRWAASLGVGRVRFGAGGYVREVTPTELAAIEGFMAERQIRIEAEDRAKRAASRERTAASLARRRA